MDMSLSKPQGDGEGPEDWRAAVHGVTKSQHDLMTEQQRREHVNIFILGWKMKMIIRVEYCCLSTIQHPSPHFWQKYSELFS